MNNVSKIKAFGFLLFGASFFIVCSAQTAPQKEALVSKSEVQHFNFENMKSETISEGITRKWFHGDKGQMTIFNLEKDSHIPWHQHPNEQITYIMSGKVKIKTINNGKQEFVIVSAGEVIVFPENVPHEFWALEKTVDLDVHVPVRQDWLSKELPDYLSKSK
ncbi:MAG: cupin domain-containing protein [Bacteroidetes bacterium]|nr:cupin domain-containing protein [Bacteroidota bacterium]